MTKEQKREIGRIMSGGETTGAKVGKQILKALGYDPDAEYEKQRQERIKKYREQQASVELPTTRQ